MILKKTISILLITLMIFGSIGVVASDTSNQVQKGINLENQMGVSNLLTKPNEVEIINNENLINQNIDESSNQVVSDNENTQVVELINHFKDAKVKEHKKVKITKPQKPNNPQGPPTNPNLPIYSKYVITTTMADEANIGEWLEFQATISGDGTGKKSNSAIYIYEISGGAGVLQYNNDGQWVSLEMSGKLRNDGGFELTPDWNETLQFRFMPTQESTYTVSISLDTVNNERIASATDSIKSKVFYQITGRILTPEGAQPIEITKFQLVSMSTGNGYGTSMVEGGYFAMNGLPDGVYRAAGIPRGNSSYASSKTTIVKVVNGIATPNQLVLQLTYSQIEGVVYNPEGQSINERVDANVYSTTGQRLLWVSSDINGKFKLGGLDVGRSYTIRVYANSNGSQYDKTIDMIIQVTAEKQFITLKLTRPQVYGQITTPEGLQVNEFTNIQLVNINTGNGNGTGAGTNGYFKISGLSDGIYRAVGAPKTSSQYAISKPIIVTVTNGIATPNNLVLQLNYPQVEGIVYNPNGQKINEQVDVSVLDSKGLRMYWSTSDIEGNFKLGGLEVGESYVLRVYPKNGSQYDRSLDRTIQVKSELQTITLQMTQPQMIGQILTPEGMQLNELTKFQLVNMDTGYSSGNGAGMNGYFRVGNLPDGTYRVVGVPQASSRYAASKPVIVTISNGVATPSNFMLQLTYPQVEGVVYDANGQRINLQADVFVHDTNGKRLSWVNSDMQGNFKLGGLEVGKSYILRAYIYNGSPFRYSLEMPIEIKSDLQTISINLINP